MGRMLIKEEQTALRKKDIWGFIEAGKQGKAKTGLISSRQGGPL